jgi:hypothetical protein
MIGAFHWPDLANYSTATAPALALTVWFGRALWRNIKHELTPNSGTSLRDAVDRIETSVSSITEELTRLDKKIERHMGYHEGADL